MLEVQTAIANKDEFLVLAGVAPLLVPVLQRSLAALDYSEDEAGLRQFTPQLHSVLVH